MQSFIVNVAPPAASRHARSDGRMDGDPASDRSAPSTTLSPASAVGGGAFVAQAWAKGRNKPKTMDFLFMATPVGIDGAGLSRTDLLPVREAVPWRAQGNARVALGGTGTSDPARFRAPAPVDTRVTSTARPAIRIPRSDASSTRKKTKGPRERAPGIPCS